MKTKLVDQTVKHCKVTADGVLIGFWIDSEVVYPPDVLWKAEADCCSDAWLYAVSGAEAIFDSPILEVDYDDETEPVELGFLERDHQALTLYIARIRTAKGTCTFELRHHGNDRYYGGKFAEIPAEEIELMVLGKEDWRPLLTIEKH